MRVAATIVIRYYAWATNNLEFYNCLCMGMHASSGEQPVNSEHKTFV